jgi:hypothetical protein
MDGLSNPTKLNWLCQASDLTNQNQKVFIAIRFMHLTEKPSDWIPGILGLGSGCNVYMRKVVGPMARGVLADVEL